MDKTFENQVAIITGGASGIGFAAAAKLYSLGVKLALLDLNPDALHLAKEKLARAPLALQADVGDETSVIEAVAKVKEHFGRIDLLFNSAGITGKTNLKTHEVPADDFGLVCRVNLVGSFLMSKAVLPHMLENGYGRICLMASIAGKEGNAGMAAYSATKAGVIGLAKTLGKEYAGTGITINALAPAVIHTPLLDDMPQPQIDYMTSRIPMGRCGTLDEAASVITYILSPENSFSTGFCFDLSGGRATY
jgi:NAD(P)-dependent dehydrogenase (short-subunit alcohol dehydrogenase family)